MGHVSYILKGLGAYEERKSPNLLDEIIEKLVHGSERQSPSSPRAPGYLASALVTPYSRGFWLR